VSGHSKLLHNGLRMMNAMALVPTCFLIPKLCDLYIESTLSPIIPYLFDVVLIGHIEHDIRIQEAG